jgi:predicted acetyltransferase
MPSKTLTDRDRLRLLVPDISLEREYREMLQEIWEGPPQDGYMLPPRDLDVAEQVEMLGRESRGENLPEGRVQQSTWWCQEDSGRLVGMIRLRHELNAALLHSGGSIGYIVRPSARQRGVATAMLRLALEKARELGIDRVLLTCDAENEASRRTIERNGGVLDTQPVSADQTWLRYWIELESADVGDGAKF